MPQARKREPIVPVKMKLVIEELLHQRVYNLEAAAVKAELTTYLARKYLKQPHVLRYFRDERAAMLEEICAGNAAALAAVRLSENGMAVTAACRQLEAMRQTVADETGGGMRRMAPGLCVVIQYSDGRPPETIGPPPSPPPLLELDAEAPYEERRS